MCVCICRVHHYCIERQPDGTVMIPDGRKFPGPVELIQHHSQYLDGFLTKPKTPCARPNGTVPMAWPGVTMLELEQILLEEAESTHHLITVRTALNLSRNTFCRHFWHATHDCVAPYVDIILHRGRFWAKSAASGSVRWFCFKSCWSRDAGTTWLSSPVCRRGG